MPAGEGGIKRKSTINPNKGKLATKIRSLSNDKIEEFESVD